MRFSRRFQTKHELSSAENFPAPLANHKDAVFDSHPRLIPTAAIFSADISLVYRLAARKALTRNPKLKRPICRNLLGINESKKSHQTALGMASFFSIHFCSNILRHPGHFNFGFRV
jgi:hypothetical protein